MDAPVYVRSKAPLRQTGARVLAGALLFASCGLGGCGSSDTSGTGGSTAGSGGTTSTGGSGGTTSSGGTAGSGGTTSSGGTGGCDAPAQNVFENATAEDIAATCIPIAPLDTEDGTYTVTIFGPFSAPFSLQSVEFAAHEADGTTMTTDPWTLSVHVVPSGGDPTAIDPNDGAKPYPLTLVDSMPVGQGTAKLYSVTLDATLPVGACEQVVVALRNTAGPPPSAIEMCGDGAAHPETNQWWNLDGTMVPISSFSSGFNHNWWVTLVPE